MAILQQHPLALDCCLLDTLFGNLGLSLTKRQHNKIILHLVDFSQLNDFPPGVSPRREDKEERNLVRRLLVKVIQVKWRRTDIVLSDFSFYHFSDVSGKHLRSDCQMEHDLVV